MMKNKEKKLCKDCIDELAKTGKLCKTHGHIIEIIREHDYLE